MVQHGTRVEGFTSFVERNERRLRSSLVAALGADVGREAAAEAFAYAWEHWERVSAMANPIGYLYRVGRSRGRRLRRPRGRLFPSVGHAKDPWVEPRLHEALTRLSRQQRVVVWLLHSAEWTMSEVAELLGISKGSVQRHADRGMRRLRKSLGVER